MNNNPIGFFDSGVGQLSILNEVKKLLPGENYAIYADQANNPLGQKTPTQIRKLTAEATSYLIKKHSIKAMVIACNTASVLGLDYLREKFNIPIVGTVPAVKAAFAGSKKSKVVVMSTPATSKSKYLDDLIKKYGDKSRTLKLGCAGLEEAIEVLNKNTINKLLGTYADRIKKFGPNIVVLGCTHYPLIKNKIQKELGIGIKVIDSGKAIALRVKEILKKDRLFSGKKEKDYYYTTGDPELFSKIASTLIKYKILAQKALPLK